MAAVVKPREYDSWDTALMVADLELNYPEDFSPGDPYEVYILLNRSLDTYELRVANDVELPGFSAESDYLRTQMAIDKINPQVILDYLTEVTAQAAARRREAAEEKTLLAAHAQRIKGVLRPNG